MKIYTSYSSLIWPFVKELFPFLTKNISSTRIWWREGHICFVSTITQSSKWKFEFTGPNQVIEFIFINISISRQKLKKWLVRTKFYWYWAGGDWSEQSLTGIGPEDLLSSWGVITFNFDLFLGKQIQRLWRDEDSTDRDTTLWPPNLPPSTTTVRYESLWK